MPVWIANVTGFTEVRVFNNAEQAILNPCADIVTVQITTMRRKGEICVSSTCSAIFVSHKGDAASIDVRCTYHHHHYHHERWI